MRAAFSTAPGRPRTASSACPAAACSSRPASGVSASTTISGMSGDAKRTSLGRVCTISSRSLSVANDRSSAGIATPRTADSTAASIGSPRIAAAWSVARSAAARRATREATRPRSVFGSARSCPTSASATMRRSATVTAVASTRPLMTSSTNSGCPPARARTKRSSSSGTASTPRRDATSFSTSAGPRSARSSAACPSKPSNGCEKPARAAKRNTTRACRSRARTSSSIPKLSSSIACATSHAKAYVRSSQRLCTMRTNACRRRAFASPRGDGVLAPRAVSTALTSSSCRPSARSRGCRARMRASESPSLVPHSTCSMLTIPESENSLPRGGHVAVWNPTL